MNESQVNELIEKAGKLEEEKEALEANFD